MSLNIITIWPLIIAALTAAAVMFIIDISDDFPLNWRMHDQRNAILIGSVVGFLIASIVLIQNGAMIGAPFFDIVDRLLAAAFFCAGAAFIGSVLGGISAHYLRKHRNDTD